MIKNYVTVIPLTGIQFGESLLEFNMTGSEVKEILGEPQYVRERQWYYFHSELRIDFDEDNIVEFIEFLGGREGCIQPLIYGLSAFECDELELYCELERHTEGEIADEDGAGHCCIFFDINAGVYREVSPGDVFEMEKEGLFGEELEAERQRAQHWETLGIGRIGYYKRPEPEAPEWSVYFEGSFFDSFGRSPAKETITLNREFIWEGETWYVLAAYVCGKGLVCDYCKRVEPQTYLSFREYWNQLAEHTRDKDEIQAAADKNPLLMNVMTDINVNGKSLARRSGCGCCYLPESCIEDGTTEEFHGKWIAQHYGLDLNTAWSFWRASFQWATKTKPVIRSMSMRLEKAPVTIPGMRFEVKEAGEQISFKHPATGICHTLNVKAYEDEQIDHNRWCNDELEIPGCCKVMRYTISPELVRESFYIKDCSDGDAPRRKKRKQSAHGEVTVFGAAAAAKYNLDPPNDEAIIGGADGVTVVACPRRREEAAQTICSSLHFEPVNQVEWRIMFREKQSEDMQINLVNSKDK